MHISRIQSILQMSKSFIDGDVFLSDLAFTLDEPLGKIDALLSSNGIIELNGSLVPGVNAQDLINVLLLYYGMASYHEFMEIAWAGRTAQSRYGVRR